MAGNYCDVLFEGREKERVLIETMGQLVYDADTTRYPIGTKVKKVSTALENLCCFFFLGFRRPYLLVLSCSILIITVLPHWSMFDHNNNSVPFPGNHGEEK